jgi:DNA-binding NarL/FixJ family response regulator
VSGTGRSLFDRAAHEQAAPTAGRAGTTEQFPALGVTELGLLGEIASGKSTRELAGELGIPSREVVDRLRHLFRKLGAAEGREALAEARRRGLLEG